MTKHPRKGVLRSKLPSTRVRLIISCEFDKELNINFAFRIDGGARGGWSTVE